jgi:hypothetical protein
MNTLMYVCMYVCMYACIYACMQMCACACVYACVCMMRQKKSKVCMMRQQKCKPKKKNPNLKSRDFARILSGLTLRVVEVRGHGHYCLAHRLAQVTFSRLLHLLQHKGADLRGRVLCAYCVSVKMHARVCVRVVCQ